jgi:hypothetical protein
MSRPRLGQEIRINTVIHGKKYVEEMNPHVEEIKIRRNQQKPVVESIPEGGFGEKK